MARRIIEAIAHALREPASADLVHFHQGSTGEPAVCYDTGCTSPQLTVR
jgi:hypothetical protein